MIASIAAMPEANANAGLAALDRREVRFERGARRVLRARVLEALVPAELVLHVGRGLIDRRDDRAGRRVGLLAGVNADGREARVVWKFHDGAVVESLHDRPRLRPSHSEFSYHSILRMGSPRLPVEPSAARRRQPAPSLPPPPEVTAPFSARELLLDTWPGRLFLIATLLKLVVAIWRRLAERAGVRPARSAAWRRSA